MLTDIIFISILLVIAQILRDRAPWLRLALVPTSMVAGIGGLVLGPHALGLIPFATLNGDSTNSQLAISQYPGVLIVVVFATLLMGRHPNLTNQGDAWKRLGGVRDMLFYSLATEIGQYGLAILFGITVLGALYPGLPEVFGVMLASGFAGGHGTAAIFGQGFHAHGWDDAMAVGFVFATVGMAAAIVGGVILINVAVRKRWTSVDNHNLDASAFAAATFAGKEQPGYTTIDSLTWHLTLVAAVLGITYGLNTLFHLALPGSFWIPLFAVSMLVGALAQRALDTIQMGASVDRATMRRIGATAADFLVASGIASVRVEVLWQYAGPILLMSIFGAVYALAVFAIGPWCFRAFWFERALFTYAWNTGVVGYGVALLRVVDPQYRSRTLEDYGTACLVISPVELMLYPAIVWACASGHFFVAGITLTLISLALFLAAFRIAHECSPSLPGVAVDSIKGQTV